MGKRIIINQQRVFFRSAGIIVLLFILAAFLGGCGSGASEKLNEGANQTQSPGANQTQSPDANAGATTSAAPGKSSNANPAGKAINLIEYLSLTTSGNNGEGKASYSFDYGAFEDVLSDILKSDKDSAAFFADATIIEESINVTLDKTSGLSNGDEVVLTVSYNGEIAKKYGLSLKDGTVTYTVKDFKEVAEFVVSGQDVIELLIETTVNHHMQNITVAAENMSNFTINDSQVDAHSETAQIDFSYDLDCAIAVLLVKGSARYKYVNDAWEIAQLTSFAEIKGYALAGVYTGTEWGIAGAGAACNAVYEISEPDKDTYEANVTWSAGDESPDMVEISAVIPLSVDYMTARFIILGSDTVLISAVGKSPYLARALKFDFINRGFTTDGEVILTKVSG